MSVTVVWDNERKTVIRYDMLGRWNWNEFQVEFQKAKAMLDSVEHTVDFHPQRGAQQFCSHWRALANSQHP